KSNDLPAVPVKSEEVSAHLRITHIIASFGEVDILNFIGHHERSKTPAAVQRRRNHEVSGHKGFSDQNFERKEQGSQCSRSAKREAEDGSISG
ncbi:hypothetical protein LSAT2_007976, partial [Lamellibrachia satsuma]